MVKQEAFLDFVLPQYVTERVANRGRKSFPPLLKLRYWNAINDAAADLGRPELIKSLFLGFQKHLYDGAQGSNSQT
ncbi:hypothetical protein [Stutzerimonas xanthomarina]|uniref:hypothetical protein n=1 Tax=Stutzerimonas xanthomarina TaxID=271420 RepID=UPI0018D4D5E1|nr:hypothetical protein [Stutzerimonas xanthomarina]